MNSSTLRKLASLTIEDGSVNPKVQAFVMTRLSRPDLKKYLFHLKQEMQSRRVSVRTPHLVDEEARKKFQALFKGGVVDFETAADLGAGIQVEFGDTIINANLKNLIERTINGIKETL